MSTSLLTLFDFIGTVAFASSGAFTAIHKKMDIFGVNMLAVTTACGGGLFRDLIIGNIPPNMFRNPFYVFVSIAVATLIFLLIYNHRQMPKRLLPVYDTIMFWFDTLGLAAFVVDGVIIGVDYGYYDNVFLLIFLGFITGVGGGALRDIMANQMPDIFVKHIYAVAAIAGAICMTGIFEITQNQAAAMISGFFIVLILRCLASHYHWNLPRITGR